MWRNTSILIIIFLLGTIHALGIDPYQPDIVNPLTQSWRWKQFTDLEGKGIRDIAEGNDGKVWVATNDGIYEYDGYSWELHNQENGLDNTPVESVFVSSDGNIYAVSSLGIYQKRGSLWERLFSVPENVSFEFNSLNELINGQIVATSDQGVIILGKEKHRFYTSEARIAELKMEITDCHWISLPNELLAGNDFIDISDVLHDHNDNIWFAVTMSNERGRLLSFKSDELTKDYISTYKIFISNEIIQLGESQKLLEAQDGSIWVVNTTYKSGISVYNGRKWEYIKLSDRYSGDEYMTDIVESDDGTIWIGALGKLFSYKNAEWNIYSSPDFPIPANRVLLQKSKGNYIWVAGYKSKVFYLDFSYDSWISYNHLNFQFENDIGEGWFLNKEGEVVFQRAGQWFSYGIKDGLMDAPIRIIRSSQGQIWAAGSHQGVATTAVLENDQWNKFFHPDLSWGIDYRAVFEDKDGALWFGAAVDSETEKGQMSGVIKLINPTALEKEFIHYPASENGLNQSNVYGIGQSSDGRIWIGGGNLYGFDGHEWQRHIDTRLQQFVNVVTSKDGLLLAGSRYYGVFIFDGKQWKNYDKSNGLSGNTIISIDATNNQCYYVATENDISRFDGSGWVSNVFPEELNMDFEGGMILHDQEGDIWINKSSRSWKRRAFSHNKNMKGGNEIFITHRYRPDKTPPETQITIYNDEVSQEGNMLVKWEGKDYLLHSATDNLMYSYKLDDGEWSPYSHDNNYTFMSLPNGKYTLQVRARDLDMNVDPTPAMIHFEVLPPVWKQMWFIMLMVAFLTVLGVYEYRVISKKRKLELLNASLQKVNEKLKHKGRKIQSQNEEILVQQEQIIQQAKDLEISNQDLEERNHKIELQKDQLEEMVEKIEELSKAKIGFFTNISHELRTPLTLISGPIEQLVNSNEKMTPETRKKLYLIIEKNTNRLINLINQLLELRRIEKSNLDLNLTPVRLAEFMGSIVSLFDNLATEKDIYLDFLYKCDTCKFNIDPDKLEKICVNLLSNAFKNTNEGDSIFVRLNKIDAGKENLPNKYNEYLEIIVEDTGTGIKQEDLEHIYERFFAAHTNQNSTGIGLSYIKELVNLMDGHIAVESEVGIGTIFKIFIPAIQATEAKIVTNTTKNLYLAKKEAELLMQSLAVEKEIKNALGSSEMKDRKKILVVDDNPDMLIYLESILLKDYNVIKAEDGEEAMMISKEQSFDLIISDVMMPKKDGLTLCEEIKSDITTSHIPVILLTAKVLEENKKEGFEKGADHYVTKPFNADMLLVRIENLLQQREQLKTSFNREFMLTPEKIKLTSPDEELLQKIVTIMEDNMENTDFNVNQMCKMVHLSHMHFIRKVKQLTGKKPVDLLKSFRLKRAKDLLKQNNLSISEVSYKVGYDLPNSFSRAFKKEFGMSPKEYMLSETSP